MSEEKYDLVFKGQLVKTVELDVAKRNLSALFKISPEKTEALFSGKPVVLKRNLDADVANKYRVAIKKAGALVDVVLSAPPVKNQPERPRGKAVFGARDLDQAEAEETKPVADTIEYTAPEKPAATANPEAQHRPEKQVRRDNAAASSLSLAPPGADVLSESERPTVETPDIDVSGYTLKPEGGTLLNPDEYPADLPFAMEITDIDIAPVGADVLTEAERKPEVEAHVDTSGLSLGEPGAMLSQPKPEPPRAPDVSNLSLVDDKD